MGITRPRPDGGVIIKKMGITRPRPDGGVIIKKMGITRPRPDGGVIIIKTGKDTVYKRREPLFYGTNIRDS